MFDRHVAVLRGLVFASALTILPVSSYATDVYGVVSDPDGFPAPGARVSSEQAGTAVWSDAFGGYRLPDVPPGEQTLTVTFDGFEEIRLQLDVPESGEMRLDPRFEAVRASIVSIEVVGEVADQIAEIPGSVALITQEELIDSKPADANEVFRRVPGVVVRSDSGPVAMRLNIGVRGLNPDRSRKVLMLEDGIPIALAPYGEPEMYYSPPIDRMRRVEVLKGSGQIVHGPQTVGGVVNFVTPEPPSSTHGSIRVHGGQYGFFAGNASVGGANRDQSRGWFLSLLRKQGDGWRNSYFDINDAQGKLTLKSRGRHTLGFKFGFYDEGSNSTYLGLTQPQWDRTPSANSVPHDRLTVRRYSGSAHHTMVLSPTAIWNNAFYAYNTLRNWGRQDFDREDMGRDYLGVDGDPSIPGGAIYLRDSAGNRNRQFDVAGGQTGVSWDHGLGSFHGKLDGGVRYIWERADDRRIDGDTFDARTGRLRDGENRHGRAFAGYLQDRIHLGSRVIVTPGLRFERYSYERDIYRLGYEDVSTQAERAITKAIPGVGLSVRATKMVTFFGGVHRGFAPPRTKIAITNDGAPLDLDAELSWNYEAGVRVQAPRLLQGELTWFRLDFENQIITAAESGGATTTLVNGGETLHQGVEASLRTNWNELVGSPLLIYTDARYMHLPTAKFTRNNLYAGNRLPYAPENTFSMLLGMRERQGFGFQLDVAYAGDEFGDNANSLAPSNDGTVGPIPSHVVWNLVADYTVRRERFEVAPYFSIKNFSGARYIASRAPQGIQPGMFRQVIGGLRFTF